MTAEERGANEPSPEALALLDAAPCGLFQTTDNGTFLRVNRTFCSWVGRPAEALIGRRRFQDLLTMGGRIFHQTHWMPLLAMQASLSEVKLDIVHTDGARVPVIVNAIRREQGGTWVHDIAVYIARDRDKYERELVLSRKRLEELVAEATRLHEEASDRALFAEQMIGIVSHDLRNPLSSISLGAALLAQDGLSGNQQRTLARITRSTNRASVLVADLLDFTRARVGKGVNVKREPIDLHETVAQAIGELAWVYPTRTINHVREGEGECVADPNRLEQLVGNLVTNAMTYGSSGDPVTVTSRIDATSFTVAVHNHGAPIPKELQATLFQPMTRGTNAPHKGRSVGLGLFIVREIARAHGGNATVTSTAEAGTTFGAVFSRAP